MHLHLHHEMMKSCRYILDMLMKILIYVLYISIHALFGITKNYRQNILKFYTENAFNIR